MSDYSKRRKAKAEKQRLAGLPRFDTETQAREYFRDQTKDLEYVDNLRFAYVGNEMQEFYYEEAARTGCCGSMDIAVFVGENEFLMGCNYGH